MEVDGNAAPWLHLQDTPTAAWIEISVIFKKNQFHLRMQLCRKVPNCLSNAPYIEEKLCIDNIENVFHPSSQALTSSLFSVIVLFVLNLFCICTQWHYERCGLLSLDAEAGLAPLATAAKCGNKLDPSGFWFATIISLSLCNLCLFYIVGFYWDGVSFRIRFFFLNWYLNRPLF